MTITDLTHDDTQVNKDIKHKTPAQTYFYLLYKGRDDLPCSDL